MTKDILINISGLQMDVDPNDPIEMMTTEMEHIIFYTMNFLKITRS